MLFWELTFKAALLRYDIHYVELPILSELFEEF